MPRDYRVRVAVIIAMLFFMGTLKGTFAYETKAKSAVSLTTINNITTKVENGRIAAIIQADGPITYKTFALHSPERVVMDITGATSGIAKKDIDTTSDKLLSVRVGTQATNDLRIVFDLKEKCSYQVQTLANGLAIYFSDFQATQTTSKNEPAKAAVAKKASPKKDISAPPVAPPDTNGISAGLEEKETKASSAKNNSEGRTSANLPNVKGPSIRPGIRAAAARPAININSTSNNTGDNPDPQSPKLRFGELGFVGDPISIDIAGVDINDVLRFISDNYGENFILDKSVGNVNVTLKVNDVPWNQVVEAIFKANQLSFTREGLIVRVATLTALAEEQAKQRAIEEEKVNNLPKQTKFFRLKYIRLGTTGTISGNAGSLGGAQAGSNLSSSTGSNTAGIGATGLVGIILKSLSKVGQVDADFRTNQIIVTDIPTQVSQIEDIIKKLDVPESQVEIEARVVLANRSFSRTIGNQLALAATQTVKIIDPVTGLPKFIQGRSAVLETSPQLVNTPIRTDLAGIVPTNNNLGSGGLIGPVANGALAGAGSTILSLTTGVIGTSLLSTAITASEQKGIAKTISNPRITVQNNTPADITSGTQIAVQTEVNNTVTTTFVTAALRLNVIPQIADEGNVLMKIVVENNSVDRSLRTTGGTPSISTQRAETLVLVPDGGTTILGGINLDTESSVNTRTPGVARVPFLGELFKKRQLDRTSSELLFFVTPRIYRPETFGAQSAPPAPAQPAANPQAQPQVLPQSGGER